MYDVVAFGQMITDPVRIEPYVQALRQAIQPGCVVADIGSGTGIFALLACQFGAGRVYAIEPNPAVHLARQMAAANGYADRLTVLPKLSTQVTLPERADVIISDMRGSLPWCQQHLPSIVDARCRLLKPGGVLIPQQDTVWVAVVSVSELYDQQVTNPWRQNRFGLDLRAAAQLVANTPIRGRAKPEQMLCAAQPVATLDYRTIEDPNLAAELMLTIHQSGIGHGLLLWFSTILAGDIGFSTGPDQPQSVYGNMILPWLAPVELNVGDTVCVNIQATLVDNNYIWRWYTQVHEAGQPERTKARFKQGTLLGRIVTPDQIRKGDDRHVPALNEEGLVDQFVLSLMDGTHSLDAITTAVMDRFPGRFATRQAARGRVGKLAQHYST